jgi:hypothetical protein
MPAIELGAPEWANAEEIERLFGLTRGTLYKLAGSNRIESALIKTRQDARKGVRLFKIESIRRLLAASTL